MNGDVTLSIAHFSPTVGDNEATIGCGLNVLLMQIAFPDDFHRVQCPCVVLFHQLDLSVMALSQNLDNVATPYAKLGKVGSRHLVASSSCVTRARFEAFIELVNAVVPLHARGAQHSHI